MLYVKIAFVLKLFCLTDQNCGRSVFIDLKNNHTLPTVTGRINKTPQKERFCNKCNDGFIGDEYHVLVECSNKDITALRLWYIYTWVL